MRYSSLLAQSLTLLSAAVLQMGEAVAQPAPRVLPDGRVLPPDVDRRLDQFQQRDNRGDETVRPSSPEKSPPESTPTTLPPADQLLPDPAKPQLPPDSNKDAPAQIKVDRYVIEGSTVLSPEEVEQATKAFTGQVTFSQLLQARTAITKLYVDRGYITSGAFIPPQTLDNGIVKIQILEGQLEAVRVNGTNKLQPGYVRRRLAIAGAKPLNINRVLEGLRVLQLDPRLSSISADLQAGIQPGTSLLDVKVSEADPFTTTISLDNGRSPSVGSVRRKVEFSHNNLTGRADELDLSYSNTNGSNSLDVSYATPVNPHNGTVRLAYGRTRSKVIEDPFQLLDIRANSTYYEGTFRQPLLQTSSEEFAMGVTVSHQQSQTALGFEDIGPFPLSPGADDQGQTKVTSLRWFQEWSKRSSQQVLAARSQLSFGAPWFGATQASDTATPDGPDSNYVSWRGQAQWVRLLAPETLLLVKGDMQVGDRHLLPLEQFGIGGQNSVRGYRQDALLTDSGFLFSTEVRIPVLRIPQLSGVLQVTPFVDVGHGWNFGTQPDKQTLAGTGLGLLWRQGNNFSARFDWGIPLVSTNANKNTWQERGLYFSVNYTPF
jgi:hemolysin activation/secretion protein